MEASLDELLENHSTGFSLSNVTADPKFMRMRLAAWLVFEDTVANHRTGRVFEQVREYNRRYWVKPAVFEPGQS